MNSAFPGIQTRTMYRSRSVKLIVKQQKWCLDSPRALIRIMCVHYKVEETHALSGHFKHTCVYKILYYISCVFPDSSVLNVMYIISMSLCNNRMISKITLRPFFSRSLWPGLFDSIKFVRLNLYVITIYGHGESYSYTKVNICYSKIKEENACGF